MSIWGVLCKEKRRYRGRQVWGSVDQRLPVGTREVGDVLAQSRSPHRGHDIERQRNTEVVRDAGGLQLEPAGNVAGGFETLVVGGFLVEGKINKEGDF